MVESRPMSRPGISGMLFDAAQTWSALALGAGELVTGYSQRTLDRTAGGLSQPVPGGPAAPGIADLVRVLPGAVAHLSLRAQDAAFSVLTGVENAARRGADRVGLSSISGAGVRVAHRHLSRWDEAFKADQARRARATQDFLATAGPETLQELLIRIDLDTVLDTVDLDAVLERIDLDAALDRIDLDRVLARVDVNELMSGAMQDLQVPGLLIDGTGALANSTVGVLRSQVEGVANRLGRRPS